LINQFYQKGDEMKILVKFILIMLVTFSYVVAKEDFAQSLYTEKNDEFIKRINHTKSSENLYKKLAKSRPNLRERYLTIAKSQLYRQKKLQKEYDSWKQRYKKSPKDGFEKLYKEKLSKLQKNLNWAKMLVEKYRITIRKSSLIRNQKALTDFTNKYNKYIKSLKKSKKNTQTKLKTSKINTLNRSSSKTTVSASNLKTNTNIKNVNVTGKTDIGSISIGKEKK
jgi:biopolymer transport protein ExbB/TolQ